MVPLSRREVLALLGPGAGFGLASAVRGDMGLAASPLQTAASGGKVAFPKDAVIRTLLKDVSPDTLGEIQRPCSTSTCHSNGRESGDQTRAAI